MEKTSNGLHYNLGLKVNKFTIAAAFINNYLEKMMDSIFILGTALLGYIFVVVKISLYVKKKYNLQGDKLLINNTVKWSLTNIVKRTLDFFLAIF